MNEKSVHAHTNLNVFGAVVALLDGGVLYGSSTAEATKDKIVRLCHKEMHRQLKVYDREKVKL